MNTQFKLIRALLILGLVVCIGHLFFLQSGEQWLQTTQASSPSVENGPSGPAAPLWPRHVRPQDLLQGPLFKSFGTGRADRHDTPPPKPRTAADFGYELIGTLVSSPALSRAIFRNTQAQNTVVCRLNDALDQVTVVEIDKDHVVLQDRNGHRFVLAQRRYDRDDTSEPDNVHPKLQPTKVPTRTYPGESFYNGLDLFMKKATLAPVKERGKVTGLKVSGLDKIPFARVAGLQNGDVITTINHQAVTSRQKAFQVFKKSRAMAHMEIELLRNHQTKTLSFDLP